MASAPVISIVLLAFLPSFSALSAPAASYSESFESGMGGWVAKHYLECEHATPPCWPLDWSIERSQDVAFDGQWSLKAYILGDHDDGTIWVQKCFQLPPFTSTSIALRFQLWSDQDGGVNRFPVVAYIGSRPPVTEQDFFIVGEDNQVVGWDPYQMVGGSVAGGATWIAFGFGATWETARTHYFDLAEVTFTPLQDGELSVAPIAPAMCAA